MRRVRDGDDVKIWVEVDELEPGRTNSHQVADYVRAMLRVRALRRALGEALVSAERRKQKLNVTHLVEAQDLLVGMEVASSKVPADTRSQARQRGQDSGCC